MTRLERLFATPYTLTEAEALALLAQPSPYTVDLYGMRERREGEPEYRPASFERFEREKRAASRMEDAA